MYESDRHAKGTRNTPLPPEFDPKESGWDLVQTRCQWFELGLKRGTLKRGTLKRGTLKRGTLKRGTLEWKPEDNKRRRAG